MGLYYPRHDESCYVPSIRVPAARLRESPQLKRGEPAHRVPQLQSRELPAAWQQLQASTATVLRTVANTELGFRGCICIWSGLKRANERPNERGTKTKRHRPKSRRAQLRFVFSFFPCWPHASLGPCLTPPPFLAGAFFSSSFCCQDAVKMLPRETLSCLVEKPEREQRDETLWTHPWRLRVLSRGNPVFL